MIIDISDVQRSHERLLRHNERMLLDAADFAAQHTRQHIERGHKFKNRSGALLRGVKTKVIRLRSGVVMRQTNTAKHAKFVEYGTRPHIIRARRRKALMFRGRGGQLIFRRAVIHRGSRAFRFGYKAHNAAYRVMGHFIEGEMERIARQF